MSDDWYTCPCSGFEFGEKGDLDLVRERPNAPEDRLALGHLFEDGDAVLPRFSVVEAEREKAVVPTQAVLQKRPLTPLMKFADYDHDGRASEFVLQIAAFPCGHRTSVVVGIDKKNSKLHVFSSVESPKDSLALESPADWEKVRTKVPVTLTEWSCGDHGSEDEETMQLSVDWAGLHAVHHKKKCELQ